MSFYSSSNSATMVDNCKSFVWTDHYRIIFDRISQFYSSGQLLDMSIVAGNEQVFAHRAILAAASPVLSSQLMQLSSVHPVQIHLDSQIEGCTAQDVNAIIQFIYCGKISIPQQRISIFLSLANYLQLPGFPEAQFHLQCNNIPAAPQRTMISTRPIHIPIPENIPGPALPSAELKSFIPISTFPISDNLNTHQSIPQLPDNAIVNQADNYVNFIMQENGSCGVVPTHSRYHNQDIAGKSSKYGEQLKSMRTVSGSLSNTSFSDLCTGEADLNMLFLNENRSFNTNARQTLAEMNDNISVINDGTQRDHHHGNIKVVSQGIFEHNSLPTLNTSEPPHQQVIAVNNNTTVDWSTFTPINDSEHLQRIYSSVTNSAVDPGNVGSTCSNVLLSSASDMNILQTPSQQQSTTPVDIEHPPQPLVAISNAGVQTPNIATMGYNSNNEMLPTVNTAPWAVSDVPSYRWCMPDHSNLINEATCMNSRHENLSWNGGGRLKVKASIGGVSVQDLSSAVIQSDDEQQMEDFSTNDGIQEDTSSQDTNNSNESQNLDQTSTLPVPKPSCGKLIIRTDIATDVSMINNTDELSELTRARSDCPTPHAELSRTASISVVQSEQLMETSAFRDCSPTSNSFNKVSVIPEQQLLETSHTSSSSQSLVGNNLVKIQIRKQLPIDACDIDFTEPTDLSRRTNDVDNNISTLDGGGSHAEEAQSDVEVVGSVNDESFVISEQLENNSTDLQTNHHDIEINHDRIFQMDTEEDLQVILTSSHQHHLYPYNYNASYSNENGINPNTDISVDDSAKAQWDLLKHKQNGNLDEQTSKLASENFNESKETKIKSSLLISPKTNLISSQEIPAPSLNSDVLLDEVTLDIREDRNTPLSVIDLDDRSSVNCDGDSASKVINNNTSQKIHHDYSDEEQTNNIVENSKHNPCVLSENVCNNKEKEMRNNFTNVLEEFSSIAEVADSSDSEHRIPDSSRVQSTHHDADRSLKVNNDDLNDGNVPNSEGKRSNESKMCSDTEADHSADTDKIIKIVSEKINKRFSGNGQITDDVNQEVNDINIKCGECSIEFSSSKKLMKHCQQHYSQANPFCCLCKKKMKTKCTLKMHITRHIVDNQPDTGNSSLAHKCSECSAVFTQRTNLVRHLGSRHQLTIEGTPLTNILRCSQCPYTCFVKYYLNAHIKTHMTNKAHKCSLCPYQTPEKYAIDRHMRTHTKEKPFECDICGFNASTPSILARHKRKHTQEKPHVCDKCGHQYADAKRLRDHMFAHDNLKPFSCLTCSMTFRRKDNLQVHIKKMHTKGCLKRKRRKEQPEQINEHHEERKEKFKCRETEHKEVVPVLCENKGDVSNKSISCAPVGTSDAVQQYTTLASSAVINQTYSTNTIVSATHSMNTSTSATNNSYVSSTLTTFSGTEQHRSHLIGNPESIVNSGSVINFAVPTHIPVTTGICTGANILSYSYDGGIHLHPNVQEEGEVPRDLGVQGHSLCTVPTEGAVVMEL